MEPAPTSGPRCERPSPSSDPASSSGRTSAAPSPRQQIATWNPARDAWETETMGLFCEHSDVFSETWPSSGMTRAGTAYALPTWEPLTDGSESSYSPLLQTPVASEGSKPSNIMGVARRQSTGQVFLTNQIVTLCGLDPT